MKVYLATFFETTTEVFSTREKAWEFLNALEDYYEESIGAMVCEREIDSSFNKYKLNPGRN